MKCDEIKEKFMELIYGEISPEDKKKVQAHLRRCKDCKKEFMELKNTSAVLQKWEIPEPNMNLVFVREKTPLFARLKESLPVLNFNFKKFGMAFGGTFAGILILLSLVNFEVTKTSEGFSVKMALFGTEQPAVDEKLLIQEMTKVQQETLQLFTRMLNEREKAQKREYQMTMAQLANALESRRTYELSQLEQAFLEFYKNNSAKIEMTNETLNQLINTACLKIEQK